MSQPKLYDAIAILPDMTGRRFSVATLGSDRTEALREQFSELRAALAEAIGVDAEKLTREDVAAWRVRRS